MTQATDYTKLTLSDREHTSNGELEHVTIVMEDKETKQNSKWTKCKRSAMDTNKRFLNKVQSLNRIALAGIAVLAIAVLAIAVLGIFSVVATAVSSSEVHPSLDVKANTTQATRLDMEPALRETTGFKELEVSTEENITKASKISSDSFHQQAELETQVSNRPENTEKRFDELKSNGDEKRKDLSKKVNRTEQNANYPHIRVERVDTELEDLYE